METKPQTQQKRPLAAWKQAIVKAESKFLAIEDRPEVAKKELGFVLQILEGNPYLQKCTPESITNAVINIARTSITLNPILKLCYLVPRQIKGQLNVVLDFSYIGLVKMLKDSGSIKHIDAYIVYQDEVDAGGFEFDINGSKVKHNIIYAKSAADQKKRKVYGAYSRVILPDNTILFTQLMPNWEIEKVRDTSESYKNLKARPFSPWTTWTEEMIKKTKLKRDFKMLIADNTSEQLAAALEVEQENNEANFSNTNKGGGIFATFADTETVEAEVIDDKEQSEPEPKKEKETKKESASQPNLEFGKESEKQTKTK